MSATVSSNAKLRGRSYDGDMAGGGELRARSEDGAREQERRGRARRKQQELTGRSKNGSTGLGTSSVARIDRR